MAKNEPLKRDIQLAETVRNLCIKEAKEGFRDASVQGLCSEGAMEAAVSAIQKIDIIELVKKLKF